MPDDGPSPKLRRGLGIKLDNYESGGLEGDLRVTSRSLWRTLGSLGSRCGHTIVNLRHLWGSGATLASSGVALWSRLGTLRTQFWFTWASIEGQKARGPIGVTSVLCSVQLNDFV